MKKNDERLRVKLFEKYSIKIQKGEPIKMKRMRGYKVIKKRIHIDIWYLKF